jgi:methylamine methyltransferase corrinoid protein reductive activase
MSVVSGDTVDPITGECFDRGDARAVGITGTGVVSLLREGMQTGLIRLPQINAPDKTIRMADGIRFLQNDLMEAGKAIGAIRAGHITLAHEAGIEVEDIETAYMSGASGTYVDAAKAQAIGMIPSAVKRIYQVGNTSLAMARDLVRDGAELGRMQAIADRLRQHHCMFAESKTFEKVYVLELSYWTEGMPMDFYQKFLKKYGLPPLRDIRELPEVIKTVDKDIQDQGVMGLSIISDIGERKTAVFEACIGDEVCVAECPENALRLEDAAGGGFALTVDMSLCNGVACRRCEAVCNENAFDLIRLLGK